MPSEKDDLVDRVTERTKGTASDPLTRDEVEQVVEATLAELEKDEAGLPDQPDQPAPDQDDSALAGHDPADGAD